MLTHCSYILLALTYRFRLQYVNKESPGNTIMHVPFPSIVQDVVGHLGPLVLKQFILENTVRIQLHNIVFYGMWLFMHALILTAVSVSMKLRHGWVITAHFSCFTWFCFKRGPYSVSSHHLPPFWLSKLCIKTHFSIILTNILSWYFQNKRTGIPQLLNWGRCIRSYILSFWYYESLNNWICIYDIYSPKKTSFMQEQPSNFTSLPWNPSFDIQYTGF